jgi:hypothetical protein
MVTDDVRSKLRGEIMPATWPELLYQFARGGLFLVDTESDLLDVALAVAGDDKASVERMLASAELRRATDDDARRFQAAPAQRFQFVIVQPWVIAQAL